MQKQNLIRQWKALQEAHPRRTGVFLFQNRDESLFLPSVEAGSGSNGQTIGMEPGYFELGSVTKLFTALLVLSFVEEGAFRQDTTVGDLLDGLPISASIKPLTVQDLLTHTSGLPRLPDNFVQYYRRKEDPYYFYGEQALLEYLGRPEKPIRRGLFSYSNLGYGLLGYLCERFSGQCYEQLVASRIRPLISTDELTVDGSGKERVRGYSRAGEAAPAWNMNALKGAGGLLATVAGVRAFLKALLDSMDQPDSLLARSLAMVDKRMAWGWLRSQQQRDILWHNGRTGGFASLIAIDPISRGGYAYLFNESIELALP